MIIKLNAIIVKTVMYNNFLILKKNKFNKQSLNNFGSFFAIITKV